MISPQALLPVRPTVGGIYPTKEPYSTYLRKCKSFFQKNPEIQNTLEDALYPRRQRRGFTAWRIKNTQFHTDGIRDTLIDHLKPEGPITRYISNKKTFLSQPKNQALQQAQKFLQGEFKFSESEPHWATSSNPGEFNSHAGWIKHSVPIDETRKPLRLTRTLGLLDGNRVRVGSVKLNIDELTRLEADQVILALEHKAQFPSEEFGKNLEAKLKSNVQEICERFLYDCNSKILQMQGELVGFTGNTKVLRRNVDESKKKPSIHPTS